ncbi:unnamed protein product [Cercospora beticola]|nr:unnamed protein product [Cercospora beticola]
MVFNVKHAAVLLLHSSGTLGAAVAVMNPAASILAEALANAGQGSVVSEILAGASAAPLPEQQQTGVCNPQQARCPGLQQDLVPQCKVPSDCNAYCSNIIKTDYVLPICQGNVDESTWANSDPIDSRCKCLNGKWVVDIVVKAAKEGGYVGCVVWNNAFSITEQVLDIVGMVPGLTAAKWVGKVFKVGNRVLAQRTKMGKCPNIFCPEDSEGLEEYWPVIDPDRMEEELGLLTPC